MITIEGWIATSPYGSQLYTEIPEFDEEFEEWFGIGCPINIPLDLQKRSAEKPIHVEFIIKEI